MTTISQNSVTKQENNEIFVGIDVSQDNLAVHILPTNEQLTIPNSAKGIKELVKRFQKIQPTQILFEATGGLERNLLASLIAAGMAVVVLNPKQARDLAKGFRQLAKTDRADAKILAKIAQKCGFEPRPVPSGETMKMNDLVTRQRQLIRMRTMEKNQLHAAKQQNHAKYILATHKQMIASIQKQIDEIAKRIRDMIAANPDWNELDKIIRSIPGCGLKTAQMVIAAVFEIGRLNRQQIAALIGLAPMADESGKHFGKARIQGGRADVRGVLYMAAMNAIKKPGVFKALHDRLMAKGKLFKVAIVAVMRKLITTINAMIKTKTQWNERGVRS